MNTLRNAAHDALAVVGILLAMQGPLVAYLTTLDVDQKILSAVFSGLGLLSTFVSKLIDSRSYTQITMAQTVGVATVSADPPPA